MLSTVLAQATYLDIQNPVMGPILTGIYQSTGGAGFFSALINLGFSIAFTLGAVIFFFMLVTGAISYMTSDGEKMKVEEARSKLRNAMIGMFALLSFWAIVRLMENIFGISLMTIDILSLAIS